MQFVLCWFLVCGFYLYFVYFLEIQRPVDEISWDLESNQEFPSQSGESLSDYPSLGISSVSPNSWGSSSFAQALQNNSQPAVPIKMPIGKPKLADNTVRGNQYIFCFNNQ